MYLTLIILPLLGSIISGFFGRKVGVTGSQLITTICVMLTTLLSIVAFFEVGLNNNPVSIELFSWIDSESLNVLWGFNFDSLTVSMLIPVLIVSSLVHLYSWGYMSHDPHIQRFMSYLSLFTFMMIILVTANNFLVMFVGQIFSAVYRRNFYLLLYHKLQESFLVKKICRKTLKRVSSETINGTPLVLVHGECIVQPFVRTKEFNSVIKYNYSTLNNNNLKLSDEQKEILIGLILADGSLEKRKTTHNARLRIDHTYPNQERYVEHLFEKFEEFCNKKPRIISRSSDKRTGIIYQSISFKTRNLPCLNEYHSIFYYLTNENKFKKIIPNNIGDLITTRSLAHWVMGDGYLTNDKTIILCTESFSEEEIDLLINVLKEKFNIISSKSKRSVKGWRIRISRKSIEKFVLEINPYVIQEFKYKLNY